MSFMLLLNTTDINSKLCVIFSIRQFFQYVTFSNKLFIKNLSIIFEQSVLLELKTYSSYFYLFAIMLCFNCFITVNKLHLTSKFFAFLFPLFSSSPFVSLSNIINYFPILIIILTKFSFFFSIIVHISFS